MSGKPTGPRHSKPGIAAWLPVALILALFMLMAARVRTGHDFLFDAPILTWLHNIRTPAGSRAADALVRFGDPGSLAAATALVVASLLVLRRFRDALRFTMQVAGAGLLDQATKVYLARPWPAFYRPMLPRSGFGFPSGHAVGGLAFFLALQLLLWRSRPGPWRFAGVLGLVLAFGVGVAVCYTQLHFPSDVVAGWALAAAWTLGSQRLIPAPPRP